MVATKRRHLDPTNKSAVYPWPRTDELVRTTAAYTTNVEHLLGICVAMPLAVSRRPSRGPLAVMLGGELIYLGVVAISLPNAPGSWGIVGCAISAPPVRLSLAPSKR